MTDELATLKAAEAAGARIQVWRLTKETTNSGDGEWQTMTSRCSFTCPSHLYRIHPEDIK